MGVTRPVIVLIVLVIYLPYTFPYIIFKYWLIPNCTLIIALGVVHNCTLYFEHGVPTNSQWKSCWQGFPVLTMSITIFPINQKETYAFILYILAFIFILLVVIAPLVAMALINICIKALELHD